jgi:hypothetical protein
LSNDAGSWTCETCCENATLFWKLTTEAAASSVKVTPSVLV